MAAIKFSRETFLAFQKYAKETLKLSHSEMLKAWKNAKNYCINYKIDAGQITYLINNKRSIASFFVWNETPEGGGYWNHIYKRQYPN